MKFAIFATVVFAFVAVAQSSVISVDGPGSVAIQASAASGPHVAIAVQTIPHIVGVPAAVHVAPVVAGQATYVARNRGVVHVAPLEGHVQSVVSVNSQAAAGTA